MGRDVGRHADCNTGGTVYQQIRITGGQYNRLFFRFIEVRFKINGVLVDVRQHLHRDLGQSRFGISHRCRAVAILRAEVSVTVNKRITGIPFLRHIDQRSVDRAVTVGMIFTHRITDDTRTFTMRLIRSVI